MRTQLLTAVSFIALMAATPAFADSETTTKSSARAGVAVEGDAKADTSLEKGWENTKEAVSEAAEDVSDATKETYESIKASLIDEDSHSDTVTIDSRMTASGMIGQPVRNAKNENIATIHDIILDQNGDAQMVVVADGGVFGLGSKYVAFDYSLVSQRQKDGDVIMPITQETLDKAAAFSYDLKDKSDKTRVIPASGISVAELLKGDVVDQENKSIANIDNVSFRNGQASQVILGFDKVLGLGGSKAAMNFDDVTLVRQDDQSFDFRLSSNQAAQFESYKKTATN